MDESPDAIFDAMLVIENHRHVVSVSVCPKCSFCVVEMPKYNPTETVTLVAPVGCEFADALWRREREPIPPMLGVPYVQAFVNVESNPVLLLLPPLPPCNTTPPPLTLACLSNVTTTFAAADRIPPPSMWRASLVVMQLMDIHLVALVRVPPNRVKIDDPEGLRETDGK